MLKENAENRSAARLAHQSAVTLEHFEVGVMNEARMYNYSSAGLYFESDFYLVPGSEIYIGINDSPFSPGVYECYRSVIKWRRFLEESYYDYGYGIELKNKALRPKPLESPDSRRHSRRRCSIPALMQGGRRRMRGVIQNASHGGVFIGCAEKLAEGQQVYLTIPLKKKKKMVTRLGEIVWSDENGVGIRFQSEKPPP
jgi:hypothetical protein